ncbi:MAG: hypothetical protein JW807_16425 [Spirochaetes bacterium]|nr:hypothetical protein [Spirochaetota bacterium]
MKRIAVIIASGVICASAVAVFSLNDQPLVIDKATGGIGPVWISRNEDGDEGVLIDEFRQIYHDKKFRRVTEDLEEQREQREEKTRDLLEEGSREELEKAESKGKIYISPLYRHTGYLGFDGYPSRSYDFLFNNIVSSFFYKPHELLYVLPVPAGTIQSSRTLESGYSMLIRLSNYPVNLLYDKIGVGWTSLIMAAKITLLDFPFARTMMVLNHEYSGHAIRAVEAGQKIAQITIGTPLPYGRGGGATYLTVPTGMDQLLMITTAGSEANMVLTHEMTRRWVGDRVIYPFDVLLYLNARIDALVYINRNSGTPPGPRLFSSGDFEQYLLLVNNKYGRVFPHNYLLKHRDIRRWSFVALADPYLYMAAGAFFYGLVTGKRYMETLMIPLGDRAGMMPSTRVSYTPNGPECSVDLFFNLPRKGVLVVYARGGSRKLRGTSGGGVHLHTIELSRRVSLGGGVDVFSQPGVTYTTSTFFLENMIFNLYPLLDFTAYLGNLYYVDVFNGYASRQRSRVIGFSLHGDLNVMVNDFFRFYFRLGYKTEGYVQGLPLDDGVFGHIGLGFYF